MPVITEISPPETEVPVRADRAARLPRAIQYRPLFSDSLLEKSGLERTRKTWTTTISFAFQCVLLGFMLVIPLMFTEALPKAQLLTFLLAPAPPPPPPPPAARPIAKVVRETDVSNNGQLRTPTRIPKKVEMLREEEAPPPAPQAGVVGGIPGGVPGGQLGGVIGGIISSSASTVAVPKLEPVKRVRVSQGVTKGLLIRKVEPRYPRIALDARLNGVVLIKAIIAKDGTIKELQAIEGHPLLIPAAIEAVKQWRYRPYLLNGEAVEVETNVTVTFQISG